VTASVVRRNGGRPVVVEHVGAQSGARSIDATVLGVDAGCRGVPPVICDHQRVPRQALQEWLTVCVTAAECEND